MSRLRLLYLSCLSLLQLLSVAQTMAAQNGNNNGNNANVPEIDQLNLRNTYNNASVTEESQKLVKRCSTVLIGKIDKVSTEYIWEIKGFLDYMEYLRDFDPNFELSSERVNFSTIPDLGGAWSFKIFKEIPIQPPKELTKKASTAAAAAVSVVPEMEMSVSVQAVHTWHEIVTDASPAEKRGINYKAILEVVYGNHSIWNESKTTIADIQFKFISVGRSKYQYIYTFKWRNVQTILENMIKLSPSTAGHQDVLFHFTMIAHLPSETKILSNDCKDFSGGYLKG